MEELSHKVEGGFLASSRRWTGSVPRGRSTFAIWDVLPFADVSTALMFYIRITRVGVRLAVGYGGIKTYDTLEGRNFHLAPLRPAGSLRACLLIELDRK
jgi:hypothetical protein